MRRFIVLTLAMVLTMGLSTARAAFIVEADNVAPAGKANGNFSATPATGFSLSTTPSTAAGLQGNQSAFGNPANSTGPDLYTFRYQPGTDLDNTVFAPGASLGTHRLDAPNTLVADPQTASGLVGGISGLYKVFITWPGSGNVDNAGSTLTINSDGAPIVLNPVNMNSAGPNGPHPIGTAGANKWLNIGTVSLTAGTNYTVTLQANNPSFTSQRVHGVMWELIPNPNVAPIVDPEAPELGFTTQGDIITTQFTATDVTALPVTFSNAVLTTFVPLITGATNPAFNGVVDSAGNFTWDTTGFARGVYTIDVTATDSGSPPLSGTGGNFVVTIEAVPEPSTLALFALAIVGSLGLIRRR